MGVLPFPYILNQSNRYKNINYVLDIVLLFFRMAVVFYYNYAVPINRQDLLNFSTVRLVAENFLHFIWIAVSVIFSVLLTIKMKPHVIFLKKLKETFKICESDQILRPILNRCLLDIFIKISFAVITLFIVVQFGGSLDELLQFIILYADVMKQTFLFVYMKMLIHVFIRYANRLADELVLAYKRSSLEDTVKNFRKLKVELKLILVDFNTIFGFILATSLFTGFLMNAINIYILIRLLYFNKTNVELWGYIGWSLTFVYDFGNIYIDFDNLLKTFEDLDEKLQRIVFEEGDRYLVRIKCQV